MGWLGRFLDGIPALTLALLDAPVVIVSFFGIVILISLGRVPDAVAPLCLWRLGSAPACRHRRHVGNQGKAPKLAVGAL